MAQFNYYPKIQKNDPSMVPNVLMSIAKMRQDEKQQNRMFELYKKREQREQEEFELSKKESAENIQTTRIKNKKELMAGYMTRINADLKYSKTKEDMLPNLDLIDKEADSIAEQYPDLAEAMKVYTTKFREMSDDDYEKVRQYEMDKENKPSDYIEEERAFLNDNPQFKGKEGTPEYLSAKLDWKTKNALAEKGGAGSEKQPTTAMAAFLKNNPDATSDEIALYAQKLKGKGIKAQLPDGTVIEIGGGSDISPKTKSDIEGKLMNGLEQYNRMKSISASFKPEYQEIGSRLDAAWTGLRAKLGKGVSKEDSDFLTDFKKYQRKSIENINLYIKEMTGAQMSEKEANRLRLAQPDPGEKWWKGDDPITFKAKMDDVLKMTRAAVARYDFYKNNGFSHNEIVGMINDGSAISLEEIASGLK